MCYILYRVMRRKFRILLHASLLFLLLVFSTPRVFNNKLVTEVKAATCKEDGGLCLPNGEVDSCVKVGTGTCQKYFFCCATLIDENVGPTTGCGQGKINTALGCIIVYDQKGLAVQLVRVGIGISGGVAFILMVYAGFIIMTSSGDPKRLNAGRELLMAAISGLLLLVGGAFLLRFIGVDILGIF